MPETSHRTLLEVRALAKRFRADRPPVFSGIDLALGPGEYLAIMGESGVGKSTLLNLIAGLDRADAGAIRLGDVEVTALDDDAATLLRRQRMGFVFQAFHVLPYLTVAQNVALPLELLGVPRKESAARVAAMLAAVELASDGTRHPRELSGGELQRVAIARALVHRPQLVLADEPTGNLDARSAAQVLALLREQVHAAGGVGLLITHSPAAARTADRVLTLTAQGLEPLA
ncbi:MAG TPA: ABC transporter ATP-binding protein [Steroidobacteraceae bacterium]|nr:ABC transporter ATP-binding protein [Steroidobacteraceae bacterium]HQW07833.1 ABC transporter ATP-binding protein [Steroidobacteraceae bacterium]HQX78525.1 ABC transporter ATP-binding protein [Steroidobacteraceae bacterium]HQZ81250.1 ABC transporter ATP-binding protein [Steroidobacteraceae bacterium]